MEELLWIICIIILLDEAYNCLIEMGRTRRFWVRPLYRNRDEDGVFAISFNHLHQHDKEQFKKMVRMDTEVFDTLFNLLEEDLTKHSNRPVISAKCRLFLTLVYLAHGDSTQYLSLTFKMGAATVRKIITECCEDIWKTLSFVYLAVPNNEEWLRIANDAIDGKHINIFCPPNSGSLFYNYKGTFSIVLLAACDANYTFTAVDIGAYGSQSDGDVLWHSEFGRRLFNNILDLPESSTLSNSDTDFPYFFVGDAAFPLKNNLMRPYPGTLLSSDKELFNKRLSRARRTIENAFGILTARWRVLLKPLHMHPQRAESIVKATVVLHNFAKMHDGSYCPPEYYDSFEGDNVVPGLWRQNTEPLRKARRIHSNNATKKAFELRDILKEYVLYN